MNTDDPGAALAREVSEQLRVLADAGLVAGIVESRSPGKPVLGIRIPPLRDAVRQGLKNHRPQPADAVRAAERLWFGESHEQELAAAMMLRLTAAAYDPDLVGRWAVNLDNWLSVDELGGWVAAAAACGEVDPQAIAPLAAADSPWQRRLYVVSLITVLRGDLDPAKVPELIALCHDRAKPVRMAVAWLIKDVLKWRPAAAGLFLDATDRPYPAPVLRLLERVPA